MGWDAAFVVSGNVRRSTSSLWLGWALLFWIVMKSMKFFGLDVVRSRIAVAWIGAIAIFLDLCDLPPKWAIVFSKKQGFMLLVTRLIALYQCCPLSHSTAPRNQWSIVLAKICIDAEWSAEWNKKNFVEICLCFYCISISFSTSPDWQWCCAWTLFLCVAARDNLSRTVKTVYLTNNTSSSGHTYKRLDSDLVISSARNNKMCHRHSRERSNCFCHRLIHWPSTNEQITKIFTSTYLSCDSRMAHKNSM